MLRFSGSIRVMQRPTARQRRGLSTAAALRSRDLTRKKKGRRGSRKEKKKGPLPLFIRRNDTMASTGIEELKKWISNNGVASMTGYALMKVIFSINEDDVMTVYPDLRR